jgi:sulfate transport system ATP-binding protein
VADRIAVFNKGRIEQVGAPDEVYDHPASAFVHQFLGHANRFEGEVRSGVADIGGALVDAHQHVSIAHAPVVVYVRPHDMEIVGYSTKASFPATLTHTVKLGPVVRLEFTRQESGDTVEVELPRQKFEQLGLKTGSVVHLKPRCARVFIDERNPAGAARRAVDDRQAPRGAPVPVTARDTTEAEPARAA